MARGDVPNPWPVLAAIAASGPAALGLETFLRRALFPPDFEEIREFLRPRLTPHVWWLVALSAALTGVGWLVQRWLVRRALARPSPGVEPAVAEARARVEAMYLSTSVPQLPALAATIAFTLGAAPEPVAVAMAASTAGVLVLGALGQRRR